MTTILRYKYVTTRKPHICFGCGRNILSPARMASIAYADGGTAKSYYLCKTSFAETSSISMTTNSKLWLMTSTLRSESTSLAMNELTNRVG